MTPYGGRVACGDEDSLQSLGDYWCPEGMVSVEEDNLLKCFNEQNICDQGTPGAYENNCDVILDEQTDAFWSLYQTECVSQSGSHPDPGTNTYDAACCLDVVINNFEIYDSDTNNVVVY
jgi:hypothetical protein